MKNILFRKSDRLEDLGRLNKSFLQLMASEYDIFMRGNYYLPS